MYIKDIKKVPIYGGYFITIITDDVEKLNKDIKSSSSIDDVGAHTIFGAYKGIQAFILIFNPNHPHMGISNGVIAHEALHAVNFLAENRGFIPDFSNDEPLTYLIQWMVDNVNAVFNKHKIPIHEKCFV